MERAAGGLLRVSGGRSGRLQLVVEVEWSVERVKQKGMLVVREGDIIPRSLWEPEHGNLFEPRQHQ